MKYTYTKNSVTIKVGSQMHVVDRSNTAFGELLQAVIQGDEKTVRDIFNRYARVTDIFNGIVTYEYGVLYVNLEDGRKISVDAVLANRLMRLYDNGENIKSMLMFIGKLSTNPYFEAIADVYRFMDHNELPITDDGDIIAYKIVRHDYTDIHTGKFNNAVGEIVSMDRNCVTHDRNQTCAAGLHFCSKEYLPMYGGFFSHSSNDRVMVVKINPKNIVSIPTDYNNAKGRCCEYEVIDEIPYEGNVTRVKDTIDRIESVEVIKTGKFLDKVKVGVNRVLGWVGLAADETIEEIQKRKEEKIDE